MSAKMNWDHLLNKKRQRKTQSKTMPYRNEFDKDYDRIIYSSSLRRLQDKAQVFPLQENDFTRTRLTHSMEVASLGRSMAWNIGSWLLEEKRFKNFWEVKELASLVEVSCLVHDLGNPPFGHYGEDIIRNWFNNWFNSHDFKKVENKYVEKGFCPLGNQQKNDFIYFEGNAQAIRILSKLQFLNDQYGANFTYGTLATLMKYPWASDHPQVINKKKFGYFYAEKELFEKLHKEVGIGDRRHPATHILEAADDIAYLTADIEDGVKKGIVKWEKEYQDIAAYLQLNYPDKYDYLEKYRKQVIQYKVPNNDLVNVQNFKVIAQGIMIEAVVEVFKDNYNEIMEGTFRGSLLDASTAKELAKKLERISIKYCYNDEEVLALELVGDRVISDLLHLFVDAVVNIEEDPKTKLKKEKLFHLISKNFRHIQSLDNSGLPNIEFENVSLYNRLLLVTDFISGMTDSYAVNLHQKLLGVKLP
ncbi:deoxyguanosinetriphosphate triphosphohydrolase [Priestia megaterium]|uniref:deoxyguanosinetriphosphate triphosphohydrolase n=1 Tax=Priestia megaterium TaxID=1404 RepID=UPI000BF77B5B|nr:deoxyguanosinetriphosphate triphosphohydrolase [Priestia megaterium]PET72761.1 deoxyguanosinetriphosphate triphosphohydrolase [Priestia megaterium]PFK88881.1 deoxyguanosinetriphosphate triphosphohydrolase [Priestia megaterium]